MLYLRKNNEGVTGVIRNVLFCGTEYQNRKAGNNYDYSKCNGRYLPDSGSKNKNAIKELNGAGVVETLVDNEIAVQNLTKMANQKGYGVKSEKISDGQYKVTMEIGEEAAAGNTALSANDAAETEKEENCAPNAIHGNTVVVISADHMGEGDEELGKVLIKGFIYALTEQDVLPQTILFITEVQS